MGKKIITISRQCGSGGHTIGKMVAEKLNIPFYDKQLLKIVAERSGLAEEVIEEKGEYNPSSLLYMIATKLSYGYSVGSKGEMPLPDQINAFQTELIRELAEKESCVIIGRDADYILREHPDCFHVFIHGKLDDRMKRVVTEHGIAPDEARHHVQNRDTKRRQHYGHYTDRTWGMAENYNLCLDSSYLGVEACVQLIIDNAKENN